jgi:hypothetical protein
MPASQMHLTPLDNLLWAFGAALKLLLCFLVFYRHLYTRLLFFCIYVVLLVAELAVVWSVYRVWGYSSSVAWYTAWCGVGILLLARALAVAELCWTSVRNYPAIWSLVRKMLVLVAVIVLLYAGSAAYENKTPLVAFFVTAERGSEISILAILVALLGFGLRYNVALGPIERSIVLGLGFYSAFQVVNDSFMDPWMTRHFHWWSSLRVVSFDIALMMWLVPLRKGLPPPNKAPALLSEDAAENLLRQVLERMREVTAELKRIGKSIRK